MIARRPSEDLTGKQRRHLRGLGHALQPVVQIGHQGLTEPVTKAVDAALAHHELIKVRVGKNAPDPDRDDLGAELEGKLGCHIVQSLGRVILLFREAKEPDDRKIRLPRAPAQTAEPDDLDEAPESNESP